MAQDFESSETDVPTTVILAEPPSSGNRMLEKLAKENMELRSQLAQVQDRAAAKQQQTPRPPPPWRQVQPVQGPPRPACGGAAPPRQPAQTGAQPQAAAMPPVSIVAPMLVPLMVAPPQVPLMVVPPRQPCVVPKMKAPVMASPLSPVASSSSAKGTPIQSGLWPSVNSSVAHFKRQDVSAEERIRRDIKNEKRSRKRQKRDQ